MGITKQEHASKHAQIMDAFAKFGNTQAVARATGIPVRTVQRHLAGAVSGAGAAQSASLHEEAPKGFTFEDFRRKFDKSVIVPDKIRAALVKMGADRFLPEADFVRLSGVNYTDLGRFRPQFEDHVVVVQDRRLWAGSAELAAAMRARL